MVVLMDKLYGGGIPEGVLKKVTLSTVMGLKYLKDEHNIIHRDVKPTNILINTSGDRSRSVILVSAAI